ncbi:MAG: FtsQ-type POTRA domain-containing protein [Alphaproteobacteria bacterium]|nr:FtsQ-type POTRA domain-containing protein [Alphaproteobacteria bacterium]
MLLRNAKQRLARLPWLRRVANLTRAGVITAALSGVVVYGISRYHDIARVNTVEVVGNERATELAVRHLADVRLGAPLLLLDLEQIVDDVVRHPWVAEATVSRHFPGTLRVEVREHHDVMLLAHDGGLYRVNDQGEVFIRARSSDLDRPILTGLSDELVDHHGPVARRVVSSALATLHSVDGCDALSAEDLSEVHFDPSLGFTLRLRNGGAVHLGFQDPADQLRRLDAMVASGLDLSRPVRVDLDLDGLAVATPISS